MPSLSLSGTLVFFSNFHSCLQIYPCLILAKSALIEAVGRLAATEHIEDVTIAFLGNGNFCCEKQKLEMSKNISTKMYIVYLFLRKDITSKNHIRLLHESTPLRFVFDTLS